MTWFVDVSILRFRGSLLQRLNFLWSLISQFAKLWNGLWHALIFCISWFHHSCCECPWHLQLSVSETPKWILSRGFTFHDFLSWVASLTPGVYAFEWDRTITCLTFHCHAIIPALLVVIFAINDKHAYSALSLLILSSLLYCVFPKYLWCPPDTFYLYSSHHLYCTFHQWQEYTTCKTCQQGLFKIQ